MKFKYCPHCGTLLVPKLIGDEGEIPYCSTCSVPLFEMPQPSIITMVINEYDEIALLIQNYVSTSFRVFVAGYLKCKEDAENATMREVEEELGLKPIRTQYIRSYYFEKKDMLMLGFVTYVKKAEFNLSKEVDKADWFKFDDAMKELREGGITRKMLQEYMDMKKSKCSSTENGNNTQ